MYPYNMLQTLLTEKLAGFIIKVNFPLNCYLMFTISAPTT